MPVRVDPLFPATFITFVSFGSSKNRIPLYVPLVGAVRVREPPPVNDREPFGAATKIVTPPPGFETALAAWTALTDPEEDMPPLMIYRPGLNVTVPFPLRVRPL